MNTQRYPLSWPAGVPRTQHPKQSAFDRHRSMENARTVLFRELNMLRATSITLSTNIELRLDGLPYSNRKQPTDKGAAVYFKLKGKEYCFPCDRWDRIEDNVYAIAKHMEAMRGQERWGVGSIEQAFRGYAALPDVSGWPDVIGVPAQTATQDVITAYRAKAKQAHPDNGGSHDQMTRLNNAYDQFKRERGL